MEDMFDLGQEGYERSDISLWIFPHLPEFLAVDLRLGTPKVTLFNTEDVFGDDFFSKLELGFSQVLRERTEHPLAHLINLPLRVEELIREMGMVCILEELDGLAKKDQFPKVAVFIVAGAALAMSSAQVAATFTSLLGDQAGPATVSECSTVLERLMSQERESVNRIDQQELREALEDQSPNYFTLWERRN